MKKLVSITFSMLILFSIIGHVASASEDHTVTREEFLTAFVTELGIDVTPYEGVEVPFEDVSESFAPYVEAALRLNITTGKREDYFGANEKVTREQAFIFLIRALNVSDLKEGNLSSYKDGNEAWAKEELATAIHFGLLNGYTDGTLRPRAELSKRHMDVIFERYQSAFDRITVVHTNDIHGRILYNESNGEMGLAKIAEVVNNVRASNPNTLLFDLGDTFHGTNYVNFNEGEAAAVAMNEMGYDLMVAGNHDFNFGYERLVELNELTTFDILGGNVMIEETGEQLLTGTKIIEVAGKKFGIVGLVAADTVVKTHPDNVAGLKFLDEVEAAKQLVHDIRDEVDYVIVTSHIGYAFDKQIAEQIEDVDVIFGGHSHTTLEKPAIHNGTYIAQAYEHTKAFGISHLVFFDGEFISVNGHLVRNNKEVKGDQNIAHILDGYKNEVDDALSTIIGSVDKKLIGDREIVRTQESNLGNLITNAMREETGADIAFTNGGGIRADIDAGDVSMDQIISAFPFVNTVIVVEATGKQILKSLEHSVRLYPEQNGGFLQVSGLSFTFDPSKPAGERVVEVTAGGEQLDLEKTYSVATVDFLAAGGDGYEWLKDTNLLIDTGELLSTVAINYVASNNEIPDLENRIVILQ